MRRFRFRQDEGRRHACRRKCRRLGNTVAADEFEDAVGRVGEARRFALQHISFEEDYRYGKALRRIQNCRLLGARCDRSDDGNIISCDSGLLQGRPGERQYLRRRGPAFATEAEHEPAPIVEFNLVHADTNDDFL